MLPVSATATVLSCLLGPELEPRLAARGGRTLGSAPVPNAGAPKWPPHSPRLRTFVSARSTVSTLSYPRPSESGLRLRGLLLHLAGRRGQDHVLVGAARGHHREHALVLVHAHVHHHRGRRAQHLLERGHDLAGLGHPD